MTNNVLLRITHLQAIRASVDALLALEEAEAQQAQEVVGCPHPEEKRQDLRTLGNPEPRFKCGICGDVVPGIA